MTGKFTFGEGDTRDTPEFNLFFDQQASYPFYSDAIWFLTQMRRWGQIAEAKPDQWYLDTAKAVYRPDLYMAAAKSLVDDGKADADGLPRHRRLPHLHQAGIDGVAFDGSKPAAYAARLRHRPEGRPDRHARRRQVRTDTDDRRRSTATSHDSTRRRRARRVARPRRSAAHAGDAGGPRASSRRWSKLAGAPGRRREGFARPSASRCWRSLPSSRLWACSRRWCRPRSARCPGRATSGTAFSTGLMEANTRRRARQDAHAEPVAAAAPTM